MRKVSRRLMHDQPVAVIRDPLNAKPCAGVVADVAKAQRVCFGCGVELKEAGHGMAWLCGGVRSVGVAVGQ